MNLKEMKEFIRIFEKSNLMEVEIENGDSRLYMSKRATDHAAAPVYTPHNPIGTFTCSASDAVSAKSNVEAAGKAVESPMVGTYYSSPAPGAAPFVKVGDIVEKGQTLCIIEAMKIMNAIEADYRCKILKVLVDNGKSVEFGQDIFMVESL